MVELDNFASLLATGVVPEHWRKTNIDPLFKRGSPRDKPGSHRTANITSVEGKLWG